MKSQGLRGTPIEDERYSCFTLFHLPSPFSFFAAPLRHSIQVRKSDGGQPASLHHHAVNLAFTDNHGDMASLLNRFIAVPEKNEILLIRLWLIRRRAHGAYLGHRDGVNLSRFRVLEIRLGLFLQDRSGLFGIHHSVSEIQKVIGTGHSNHQGFDTPFFSDSGKFALNRPGLLRSFFHIGTGYQSEQNNYAQTHETGYKITKFVLFHFFAPLPAGFTGRFHYC